MRLIINKEIKKYSMIEELYLIFNYNKINRKRIKQHQIFNRKIFLKKKYFFHNNFENISFVYILLYKS